MLSLVIGGALVYVLSLSDLDPETPTRVGMAAMISIVIAGLCVIGATSNWWLKR